MDRFNEFADANGFIRLTNVPGVQKFLEMLLRFDNTLPCDSSKALYKVLRKSWSMNTGDVNDYIGVEPAAVFIQRVKYMFPTGWLLLSRFEKETGSRSNQPVFVYGYDFVNTSCGYYSHGIRVHYADMFGEYKTSIYKAEEVNDVVFKPINKEELEAITSYVHTVSKKPEPTHQMMMILPEYKEDYSLYLKDCERYGFKPIEKKFIDTISMDTTSGFPMTFMPDGVFGTRETDDCVIINKPWKHKTFEIE